MDIDIALCRRAKDRRCSVTHLVPGPPHALVELLMKLRAIEALTPADGLSVLPRIDDVPEALAFQVSQFAKGLAVPCRYIRSDPHRAIGEARNRNLVLPHQPF